MRQWRRQMSKLTDDLLNDISPFRDIESTTRNKLHTDAAIHIKKLEQALDDALGEWEYNAVTYKSAPLIKKHEDLEQIMGYRKLLESDCE